MMCFSVLMSVYVKEEVDYLSKAISSIWLNQTVKPEQIVLVKDGPLTLELNAEIDRWQKLIGNSLVVVKLAKNVGLASALNEGFKFCSNDLVARMDSDDISPHDRFEKQVEFMNKHPHISVSSGQMEEWNQDFSEIISYRKLPLHHDEIVKFSKIRSPISHAGAILRKSSVLAVGGYPMMYPEDYLLWGTMISKGYKFANIPDLVLKNRVGNALTDRRGKEFFKGVIRTYFYLNSVGLINRFELIRNIILRCSVMISPTWLKKMLYKSFR
jgi:glycosyltransferase involved in cell wall biosynthesis